MRRPLLLLTLTLSLALFHLNLACLALPLPMQGKAVAEELAELAEGSGWSNMQAYRHEAGKEADDDSPIRGIVTDDSARRILGWGANSVEAYDGHSLPIRGRRRAGQRRTEAGWGGASASASASPQSQSRLPSSSRYDDHVPRPKQRPSHEAAPRPEPFRVNAQPTRELRNALPHVPPHTPQRVEVQRDEPWTAVQDESQRSGLSTYLVRKLSFWSKKTRD